MASIKSLVSQTAIYGVSTTVSKFLNYLLTPYFTRIMSEDVYGEYSYYYSIIPIVSVLLTMGFATSYFRFAGATTEISEQKKLFTTLWGSVAIFALLFCGVWAAILPTELVIVTLALILVDNVAAIPLALLRQQGRALYYTVVNITGVLANVGLCFLFYQLIDGAPSTAFWGILANVIASSISLILLLPVAIKMLCSTFSKAIFKRVFLYSLPLMVAGLMGVANDFIDRQVLRWALPENIALSQIGIYSAVAKIAALMMIFRQIYTLGAEPFFLQKFSKDDFSRLNAAALKYFVAVGIVIYLVIAMYADVAGLLLGGSFRVALDILPLLLLGNLLAGVVVNLSFWYKAADMTRIAIYVTLSGLTVSLAFNLLMIPHWGYVGASWARVASMVVMVTISYFLGQKYYPVKYDLKAIGFYALIGGVIFSLSYLTAYLENGLRWSANFLLILGFVAIFVNKEKLLKIKR